MLTLILRKTFNYSNASPSLLTKGMALTESKKGTWLFILRSSFTLLVLFKNSNCWFMPLLYTKTRMGFDISVNMVKTPRLAKLD